MKLWDAGYIWELCKLLTQMLDEGGAKYLTFTDAKITNDTRLKLVGMRVSQPAHKQLHSTNIALLKEHSDITLHVDNGKVTAFNLLHLSELSF